MIPATLVGPDVRYLQSQETGVKIPCVTAKGLVFLSFDFTPEEKELVSLGCPIWVVARGPFIPELTLRVGEKNEVIPYDMQRQAVRENVPGGDEAERAVAAAKITPKDRMLGHVFLIAMTVVVVVLAALLGAILAR